eukprot:13300845-Alexandrium_andersonii.AAC.1
MAHERTRKPRRTRTVEHCAAKPVDGLRPKRCAHGPMVLVRGTQAQREEVEVRTTTQGAILAAGRIRHIPGRNFPDA